MTNGEAETREDVGGRARVFVHLVGGTLEARFFDYTCRICGLEFDLACPAVDQNVNQIRREELDAYAGRAVRSVDELYGYIRRQVRF